MLFLSNLTFLNPIALLAFLGIAVPIAIHLWSQRSGPPAWFPTLRLLESSFHQEQRKRRLHQIILLCTRILLFTLLILAAARPSWQHPVAPHLKLSYQEPYHLLILDESAGMWREVNGSPLARQNRESAIRFLESLSELKHRAQVVILRDQPHWLSSQPDNNFDRMIQQLRDYPESHQHGQYTLFTRRIPFLSQQFTKPVIHLWTDAAKSSWPVPEDVEDYFDPEKAQEWTLNLYSPENTSTGNLSVTGMQWMPAHLLRHQSATLTVKVSNPGSTPAEARFTLKGLPELIQQDIQLKPGETRDIHIRTRLHEAGHLWVEAELSNDSLQLDNQWAMMTTIHPRQKLGLISAKTKSDEPTLSSRRITQAIAGPEMSPYLIQSVKSDQFSTAEGRQSLPPILILHDIKDLPDSFWPQLRQWITTGGQLMIIPHRPDRDLLIEQAAMMLPTKEINLPVHAEEIRLSSIGLSPQLSEVFTEKSRQGLLTTRWPLAFNTLARSDTSILAQWSDRNPALMLRQLGHGTILLFNTALDAQSSVQFDSPYFLPLLHECLIMLQPGQRSKAQQLVFTTDLSNTSYQIIGPDKVPLPYQSQSDPRSGTATMFPEYHDLSGDYRLLNSSGKLIDLQHQAFPYEESKLLQHTKLELTSMIAKELQRGEATLNEQQAIAANTDSSIQASTPITGAAGKYTETTEFWPWLLFAALLIIALEIGLAHPSLKSKTQTQNHKLNSSTAQQKEKAA